MSQRSQGKGEAPKGTVYTHTYTYIHTQTSQMNEFTLKVTQANGCVQPDCVGVCVCVVVEASMGVSE